MLIGQSLGRVAKGAACFNAFGMGARLPVVCGLRSVHNDIRNRGKYKSQEKGQNRFGKLKHIRSSKANSGMAVLEKTTAAMENIYRTKKFLDDRIANLEGRQPEKAAKTKDAEPAAKPIEKRGKLTQSFKIIVRGEDKGLALSYAEFIRRLGIESGFVVSELLPMPLKVPKLTLLRSVFVHKKSRVQYEKRIYSRQINVYNADKEVGDRFIDMIGTKYPAHVGVSVDYMDYEPLPKSLLEVLPSGTK
eukprot:Nk52_evm30s221 gene=Nk52_evmTU30s221